MHQPTRTSSPQCSTVACLASLVLAQHGVRQALRKLSAQLDLALQGRLADLRGFYPACSELYLALRELNKQTGRSAATEQLKALRPVPGLTNRWDKAQGFGYTQ